RPRPPVQTYNGDAVALSLPTELARALGRLSRQESASLFMTLLAAFKVLLARYSAQDDIVVGSPIAGRNRAEIEHLIGFFLNSLVLRTDLSGEPSFRELLARVRNVTLDAYAHQDVPFEKLVEHIDPPRDPSRTPLFQVMFNMLPDWQRSVTALADLTAEPLAAGRVQAKFDLTVFAAEQPDGTLALRFVYNTDLFERATIERMAGHYRTLLEAVVEDPARSISRLPILTPEERQAAERAAAARVQIPEPAGASAADFPAEALARSIPERFREVVERAPDAVAVETARARWTYEELQQRANQVAHALLRETGSDNQRVALFLEHDAPMLAAILGTLTAGKTYVPLDPAYPEERLRLLLEDAEPQAILTDRPASELSDWAGELPVLELSHIFAAEPEHAPELTVDPATPAYILYTSGSTGRPKGVVQSQRNVLHHIRTYASRLRITPHDRLSLLAAYGFDAAVMDIFGALLSGATLYPIDLRGEDAGRLSALVERHGITVLHSTPTVFRHLTSQLTGAENLSAVRLVVLGGEAATRHDLELFRRHFGPHARLINGYGPTECTLALQHVFDHTGEPPRTTAGGLPIGRAVDGLEVLLLNEAGEPVETLAPGEIVLRSPYVALGYWRSPELTAERFVADPSATEPGVRLYHTGDRARWLPDGTLEFLGRIDQQVKVRGYRIEPGEIESILASENGISAAVV